MIVSLVATGSTCQPTRTLAYFVEASSRIPRTITVELTIRGASGASLDLKGYGPREVMRVEGFEARGPHGAPLHVVEATDTVRVGGRPIGVPRYRIQGPVPPTVTVRYCVSPGRREGNEHMGFSGRCFGHVGPDFAMVTGRQLFLVPQPAATCRQIEVRLSLPSGWSAVTPWRRGKDRWFAGDPWTDATEHLVTAAIGLGPFRERSFLAGRTRFRLAFQGGIPEGEADRAGQAIERVVGYVCQLFGRDLGPQYVAVIAPETPDGDEVVGEAWATGQGGTLVPLTAERLRRFAQQLIEAYVRYAPYRTAIGHSEEFWLVDAVTNWYSLRAVAKAGMANEEEVNRSFATAYLAGVTTEGMDRNLERLYAGTVSDRIAREVLAPFALFHLDHELRSKYGLATGFDAVLPRLFADRSAPCLWSLLPRSSRHAWDSFRARYIRGTAFAPVPDLFALTPTRPSPSPPGGKVVQFLTVVYTGNTYGYLENCGCKVNQSGGVARRATVVDRLRRADREALLLDAGNAFVRSDEFESPNFFASKEQRLYLETMDQMRYDAAAISTTELANGLEYFRKETRGLMTPFLAANVLVDGTAVGPGCVLRRSHGRTVAVIGIFEPPRSGKSVRGFNVQAGRMTLSDPMDALRRVALAHRRQVDLLIALGRLSPWTIRRAVEACPEIDVIISTEYDAPQWADSASSQHKKIQTEDRSGFLGRTLVLYTQKGQYGLGSARRGLDRTGRITMAELTEHWLGEDVPDQASIRRRLNHFYDRIGRTEEAQASVRPPLADDPYWQHRPYAGAAACADCHSAEFAQWKTTAHATAYKTLLDRHRHYQPKCVSCHVVGFGSEYGYRVGQPEEPLGNVQCEVCHGPGAEHVAAPTQANIRREVPEHVCLECHNPEHSDHFMYVEMLPKVRHDLVADLSTR